MRKPVFLGILFLLFLYSGIFVTLVSVQFAGQGGFTQRVGGLVVSGRYRPPGDNDPPIQPNEYFLDGGAAVFFGGAEFGLAGGGGDRLYLNGEDGTREEALPERMLVSADSVRFSFPGGTELAFTTHYAGGAPEVRISGVFPEGLSGLELPFKPQRKSEIRESGDGQLIIRADGVNYSFGRSPMDAGRRALLVNAGAGPLSYRAVPERTGSSPDDFILPEAAGAGAYNEAVARWRDRKFPLWNSAVSERNDEDIVIALAGEALARGTYRAAVAAVPQTFLTGTTRTYESSVYLGGLEQASRSIAAGEREKAARLSRQINEQSLEFLLEPGVFEYLAVRGNTALFDAGAELIKTIDPATLALDITPGILEGYTDWRTYRPGTENPFERLLDRARAVVFESLRKSAAGLRVFAFGVYQGETEFNLRLGQALVAYAEPAQDAAWAGIGRSLILSALSADAPDADAARLCRALNPADMYPRALPVTAPGSGVWAWTAARALTAAQRNDTLDITVSFPAGEAHYMMIRGIRPFIRLQLHGADARSDPQFERGDSSGWVYYSQDQTLVLKIRHRAPDELVRIVFREEPRSAAAPAPVSAPPAPPVVTPVTVPAPAFAPVITPVPAFTPAAAPPAAALEPPAADTVYQWNVYEEY
jgi:hypothetical protein